MVATPVTAQMVPQQITRREQQLVTTAVDKLRFNQPWSYYSTILIPDFGELNSQVLSFWQATKGTPGALGGLPMTNLVQPGQIPEAFRVYGMAIRIAISIYDDPRIFELLANFSAIEMKVGSDEMMVGPVTQFPAAGGVTGFLELGPQLSPPQPRADGDHPSAPPVLPKKGQAPPPVEQCPVSIPSTVAPDAVPYNVLTNGVPHRSNLYSFANDPIKVKKGANITTDLHIAQGALKALQSLTRKPMAPGVTIQLKLEGRRARAAGYGTGG